ncbi:MAG: ABC transporter permease, partial [Armatimonadota bacterium]
MKLWTAVRIELVKLYRRPSTYIGFAVLAVLVALIVIGTSHRDPARQLRRSLSDDFVVAGKLVAAPFVAFVVVVPGVVLFLPVLASMVAGDQIAAERRTGTLRTLLTRPVPRGTVYAAKFLVSVLHTVALATFLGGFALAMGLAFFGRGGLLAMGGTIRFIPEGEALWRLGLAYAMAAWCTIAITTIALFFSTFLRSGAAAAAIAVAFLFVCSTADEILSLEWLSPYLMREHILGVQKLFETTIPVDEVLESAGVMGLYMVVPLVLGFLVFRRKDVL